MTAIAVATCVDDEGSVGGLPEGWLADRHVQWHQERHLPGSTPGRPMACGDVWDLSVEAYDIVEACEGYDFSTLYGQAVADGEAIARDRQCDDACVDRRPVTQVGGSVFWCAGGEAHASVWVHFLCRRDETEVFPWAARPASAFTPQPVPERPTARPASPVEFFAGARAEVACGSSRRISFNHERAVDDRACASFNLEGIRDGARNQARQEWERYSCATGCVKQPFAPLLERWRCSEGPDRDANEVPDVVNVTVDVSFEVACR